MKTELLALSLAGLAFQTTRNYSSQVSPPVASSGASITSASGMGHPRTRTLWKNDFVRHTLSFVTGAYGLVVQNNGVFNFDSEIDYGNYFSDQFYAGVQGAQVGELIDLGTTDDLSQRYGYQETVGGGQGFSSIRYEGTGLVILSDLATGATQPFSEGQAFLDSAPTSFSVPMPVALGHIYLVRIQDLFDPSFLRFVKLKVTAHRTDESVTFMWEEIEIE